MHARLRDSVNLLGRSLLVGIGYLIVLFLSGMLLGMLGLISAEVGDPAPGYHWFFLAGMVMGLALGPIAARLPASRRRHTLIWGSLLYFNMASVIVEGAFFAPALLSNPGVILGQQLLICAAIGILIAWLFAPAGDTTAPAPAAQRSWFSWTWRFLISALSYLIFYFVFGALNYAFVTQSYYAANPHLAVPAPQVVLMAESVRAPLIVFSLLPFLLTVRMPKRRLALWSGFLLFAIGGVVPLIWQIGNLPLFLLVASGWEILAQNFLTGVVAAYLLGGHIERAPAAKTQRLMPLGA